MAISRAGAAWGARGARAPPVFLGEGNKKLPNSFLQKGLFSIVHPLKLAPCAGPGASGPISSYLIYP